MLEGGQLALCLLHFRPVFSCVWSFRDLARCKPDKQFKHQNRIPQIKGVRLRINAPLWASTSTAKRFPPL